MAGHHAGSPQGVPDDRDWRFGPRISMGNNPRSFTAMTAWGQLYEDTVGRATIDPHQIAGVFTTVQARLIVDDPQQADDRHQSRYLLWGGDHWLNTQAQWDQWQTNGDIAIGRFKYVGPQWQAFNMTTPLGDGTPPKSATADR